MCFTEPTVTKDSQFIYSILCTRLRIRFVWVVLPIYIAARILAIFMITMHQWSMDTCYAKPQMHR